MSNGTLVIILRLGVDISTLHGRLSEGTLNPFIMFSLVKGVVSTFQLASVCQ